VVGHSPAALRTQGSAPALCCLPPHPLQPGIPNSQAPRTFYPRRKRSAACASGSSEMPGSGHLLAELLPLKCHSLEGGIRFYIRKSFTTLSPLTESNRRPSPYHGDALPTELRGHSRRIFCPAWRGRHRRNRVGEHTRPEIITLTRPASRRDPRARPRRDPRASSRRDTRDVTDGSPDRTTHRRTVACWLPDGAAFP
jgi:hypothetical protein